VQIVDVRHWLVVNSSAIIFAQFHSQIFFFQTMVECTNFSLIAPKLVAINPLVLIRVVQTLYGGMAFGAFESVWTLVPAETFLKNFTVFRGILEYLRGSSKVAQVVGINTSLTVVAIFFGGAPRALVHEHIENEPVFLKVKILQIVVQKGTIK
jgi:hypothetical protein